MYSQTQSAPRAPHLDFFGFMAAGVIDLLSIDNKEVTTNLNSALSLAVHDVVHVLVVHVVGGARSGFDGSELPYLEPIIHLF